jgi:hypothetical protein
MAMFWDETPCSPVKVIDVSEEDGGEMFLRNVYDFCRATRRYVPEDKNFLYSSPREAFWSYKD